MDIINNIKSKYDAISRSRNFKLFTKFGLPMFVFTVGGSYILTEFQEVRFEHKTRKHEQEMMREVLAEKGMDKVDMKAEYERIKNVDTSNYRNIRGPRAYEDNTEFLKNRQLQEERLAKLLGKNTSEPQQSITPQ